ncbi:RHS repeat-associated core domain-containing protein [Marininema halotolerans]|nr:RHS repeat-associated core domain-containing protein [Marininema halotolerans]
MTRDGKAYYYHTNYRGDVTALTDSTGTEVATYEYDAFGNLVKETGDVDNPYRYAGYRYDEVTALYYLQSRYYNPEMGRFLTRDTFVGEEKDPLSLNKYSYVSNNPIAYDDPTGHFIPAWIVTGLLIAIGEAAAEFLWDYGWKFWKWPKWKFCKTVAKNFAIELGGAVFQTIKVIRWGKKVFWPTIKKTFSHRKKYYKAIKTLKSRLKTEIKKRWRVLKKFRK